MITTATVALESLPGAREILRELDSRSPDPLVYLLRGRAGTGKSTLLAAIRARLRGRGIASCDDVATTGRGDGVPPALIIDDAHTLERAELEKLTVVVESGCCTVVVATRPRPHDITLRGLIDAVSRRGRVLDLRALGVADIAPFARELGMMVPRQVAQHIHRQTAGIHGGVVAALSAACATRLDAGIGAVDDAVTTWARSLLDGTDPRLLDVFVVATTGAGLDPGELTEVLDIDHGTALDLIDRARASALVTDADLLLAPAIAPLRTLVGDRRFLTVQRRLFEARLEAGLLRDHTALLLAESGVRDPRLAAFLCATAEKTGEEAVRYYAAAAASGADRQSVAVRWAEAAARAGDGETALRLAEPVLGRATAPAAEVAAAVRVCAGVWTRRGLAARAAQLYTWLGPQRAGADRAIGATVHYLVGDIESATASTTSAAPWPPTEATARAGLIATAVAQSLGVPVSGTEGNGSAESGRAAAVAAASALIQAARATDPAADSVLPCTAVSIATLLCLSMGEPRRAADALRAGGDRDPHLLVLAAWTAMLGGDEQTAAKIVVTLDFEALSKRDRLLAHGVAVGLARRGGDHTALVLAWEAAYPLFDEVGADLLALLPIGELWLAGIRLRDEGRVTALVDAVRELLRRLDHPPAWSNAFHWYAIQAAIAHERPDELLPPAQQLKAAALAGDPHAAVLADAGRTWVLVLRGQVSQEKVTAAVRRLAGIGLIWDAARLASEAALAADDSATATALLKLARTIRTEARPQQHPIQPPEPAAPPQQPAPATETLLSEREREVAELVLLGLTYREIGARLYISAKTVEHHVARIRRRIGAGSRSELLSMLRAMGHGSLLV
ncbi:LuxR C-terminal-related transcriptional regulator [Nocardia transvalensis]|uniref:LuxR C-terminal-related transcriptional regulator n=1 Tax=Nocardia transvalensis TaxID=37333 RepID=UPI002B4B2583|nr:LuxR C-terminal-related transcriptional regulator [Nocardia transvalensis]